MNANHPNARLAAVIARLDQSLDRLGDKDLIAVAVCLGEGKTPAFLLEDLAEAFLALSIWRVAAQGEARGWVDGQASVKDARGRPRLRIVSAAENEEPLA